MKKNINGIIEILAIRLKSKRKSLNYSRDMLSELSGISSQTIGNIEKKRLKRLPDTETLVKLADALNCNIDYLLGIIDESTHDLDYICSYTGLSESAVNKLHEMQGKSESIKLLPLNSIITSTDIPQIVHEFLTFDISSGIAALAYDNNDMSKVISISADSLNIAGINIGLETVDHVLIEKIKNCLNIIKPEYVKTYLDYLNAILKTENPLP